MKTKCSKHILSLLVFFIVTITGCILSPAAMAAPTAPSPKYNFYLWANHEWLAKTVIAPDKSKEDNFSQLADVVDDQLKSLFAAIKASDTRSPEQEKLLRLYESFVQMDQRDIQGLSPIADELKTIDKLKTHLDVARHFAYLQTIGILSPIVIASAPDFKDSTTAIGFVSQAGLGLERDYYLAPDANSRKQIELYQAFAMKLLKLAAIAKPEEVITRVLALETKIATIQWSRVDNRDSQKVYNPASAKEFFKRSEAFYGKEMSQIWGIPENAKLNLMQPDYLKKFGMLFRNTPVPVWQDYLRVHLLVASAELLNSDFMKAQVQYDKELGLIQQEKPMWKQGIDFVSSVASLMLGRAYVEKYFDPRTKASVQEMVLAIRDTYRTSIAGAAWMSQETKQKAIEKLDKMQFKIGYPDTWRDYSSLEIPGLNLFENFKRAMQFDHRRNMAKIGQPVDRSQWERSPHEINAFYDTTRNEFVLLAAILHEPFYSEKGDAALKYGGLGFVVGHEIGHGFDDQGCRFDGDGNIQNWWTEADAKAYSDKSKQLIAQANAYEILPGTYLKGAQEIGEIMGDLAGAQIALRAYLKTPNASDKAFFIQLAQTWRSKWRDEFLKMVVQSDNHPPSEFRANGIVKQFNEFHQAFDVKPGDKMYQAPENRVLLW